MVYRYHLQAARSEKSILTTSDIEVARSLACLMTDREACKRAALNRYWLYLELHDEVAGRTLEAYEFGDKCGIKGGR